MGTTTTDEKGHHNDDIVLGNINDLGLHVADHIDAMLAYWDKDQVCRFANNAYLKFFKKSREEVVGKVTMKEFKGIYYKDNGPFVKKVLKGKKQIFERKMLSPAGTARHVIVKYYPDFAGDKVVGFFMHAEDITLLKKLQAKVLELEKSKKRTILRYLIESQETERELIAHELRDNASQTLAYCKMTLKNMSSGITQNIHKVIDDLNELGSKLSPAIINMMGFCAGVSEYIKNFQNHHPAKISFECDNNNIDKISINDKLSIFRIIQDYLLMIANHSKADSIVIAVDYVPPKFSLRITQNMPDFTLLKNSKEFMDIENRIDYYGGSWQEFKTKGEMVFLITLKGVVMQTILK